MVGSTQRIMISNLYFDVMNFDQAVSEITEIANKKQGSCSLVVTPNVDHVMRARQSESLARIYRDAILSLADGMPIVWLSKLIGKKLPCRVTGADLLPALATAASKANLSIFLFGGPDGAAERASAALRSKSPSLKIDCYMPPFGFEKDRNENSRAIAAINRFNPDLLFVGLGSPKQEIWISTHASQLRAGIAIGVGAAIEFTAGDLKRAPKWMQNSGLEWVYRLMSDPKRLAGRYVANILFITVVLQEISDYLRGKFGFRSKNTP